MKTRPKGIWLTGFALVLALVGCRPAPVALSPPAELKELEGYARLRMTLHDQPAKSRFSFLVQTPGRGRVQVFDPLNRTLYEIYVDGERAYFVLPGKKVYWQGTGADIFEKFLGFSLSLQEMTGLLSGLWREGPGGPSFLANWTLRRDTQGRVVSGGRADFQFFVEDFFAKGRVPRRVNFKSRQSQGRLDVLSVEFNRTIGAGLLSPAFLKDFSPVGWEEIEKILKHET